MDCSGNVLQRTREACTHAAVHLWVAMPDRLLLALTQEGDFPWRYSMCAWTMASEQAQIMVVNDDLQDARWATVQELTSPVRCGAQETGNVSSNLITVCTRAASGPGADGLTAFCTG